MNTREAIINRVSTRTFKDINFTKSQLESIVKIISSAKKKNVFGTNLTFGYLPIEAGSNKESKIGTYGVFSGQRGYIYGVCTHSRNGYIDFSYAFEYIVLELTKLGIATCWVAGTFDRKKFLSNLELDKNQVLPAILPIGYASDKLRFTEKLVKRITKPRNRKSFADVFFTKEMESYNDMNSPYMKALEMVRIGPSAINKQPWRLIIEGDLCHFYDVSKGSDINKFNSLDVGIAAYHLHATLEEEGFKGQFINKNPNIKNLEDNMQYYCSYKLKK